jgi:hypothetical protein
MSLISLYFYNILQGEIRTHTKYFKEIRNTRLERYSMETNKLIIRLDKLLNNLPNDLVERKGCLNLIFILMKML